ncbi:MAG: hypothetical protein H0W89_05120 [Candidatus Levybacteria bacterium]|nr:hypothetical protein [Candidatus Levybacteria bacterium]
MAAETDGPRPEIVNPTVPKGVDRPDGRTLGVPETRGLPTVSKDISVGSTTISMTAVPQLFEQGTDVPAFSKSLPVQLSEGEVAVLGGTRERDTSPSVTEAPEPKHILLFPTGDVHDKVNAPISESANPCEETQLEREVNQGGTRGLSEEELVEHGIRVRESVESIDDTGQLADSDRDTITNALVTLSERLGEQVSPREVISLVATVLDINMATDENSTLDVDESKLLHRFTALTPRQQEIAWLRYNDGLRGQALADKVGVTKQAISQVTQKLPDILSRDISNKRLKIAAAIGEGSEQTRGVGQRLREISTSVSALLDSGVTDSLELIKQSGAMPDQVRKAVLRLGRKSEVQTNRTRAYEIRSSIYKALQSGGVDTATIAQQFGIHELTAKNHINTVRFGWKPKEQHAYE